MMLPAIEVFRTNVPNRRSAAALLRCLQAHFPACRITFDLSDCDRVLRVASSGSPLDAPAVAAVLHAHGYACAPLPD